MPIISWAYRHICRIVQGTQDINGFEITVVKRLVVHRGLGIRFRAGMLREADIIIADFFDTDLAFPLATAGLRQSARSIPSAPSMLGG